MKALQAALWNRNRKSHKQNMTLSELRDVLLHKLHSESSLTVQSRKDINKRLVKVMDLLAQRRMQLREKDSLRLNT